MEIEHVLARNAGVVTRAALTEWGVGRRHLDRAIAAGTVRRLRPGWYASEEAPPDVVRSIQVGGRLGCGSALAALGVWMMPDERLHVSVPRGTQPRPVAGVVMHWVDDRLGPGYPVDDPTAALARAILCLDRRAAIVAVDSAVNKHLITDSRAVEICQSTPRGRQLLRHLDFRSQSGLETIARLALRAQGLRVTPQVFVENVGWVDLVIGDRLVLELDGEAWHDRPGDFESDRRRDRVLVSLGYIVIRASYRQVMYEWPLIEAQIMAVVRRGEHHWRKVHGRG